MKKILPQYHWKMPNGSIMEFEDKVYFNKQISNPKGIGSKKRGKDGRFQKHIYIFKFKHEDRLSLLLGIFTSLVVVLIYLLNSKYV